MGGDMNGVMKDILFQAGLGFIEEFGIDSHPPVAFLLFDDKPALFVQIHAEDRVDVAKALFELALTQKPDAVLYLTETHVTNDYPRGKVADDPSAVDGFAGIYIDREKILFRHAVLKETEDGKAKVTDPGEWFDVEKEGEMKGFFIAVARAIREVIRSR